MFIKTFKVLCIAAILLLVACRTNPPSSPAPSPGSPTGSPVPSTPSPGSPVPSSGGGMPPRPGELPDSGSPSGSESAKDTSSEDVSTIPPEWEDDEIPEGEGSSESGVESDDTSFEEDLFEEAEELSEVELEELEKELDESLGDFDETIRREQEYAEENANDNADDDSLGGVGTFETYNESSENNNESNSPGSANNDSAEIETPDDIPDAKDDDIVARQIREAALKEKDPVLREKLWEEYRKYKKQ